MVETYPYYTVISAGQSVTAGGYAEAKEYYTE
jgi:hypothetical protein